METTVYQSNIGKKYKSKDLLIILVYEYIMLLNGDKMLKEYLEEKIS